MVDLHLQQDEHCLTAFFRGWGGFSDNHAIQLIDHSGGMRAHS